MRYAVVAVAILLIIVFSVVLGIMFVVAVVLGLGMEALQSTLARRDASSGDALANAGGAAVAVVLWRVLLRRVRLYRVSVHVEKPL